MQTPFKPIVSLIIPCYNAERFIPRCVSAIKSQLYETFETIWVNDGSTDATASLLDKYAQEETSFKIIHSTNQGVSHARNLGISHACGDYICFADVDDEIAADYLLKLVEIILKTDSDLCITGLELRGLTHRKYKATTDIFMADSFSTMLNVPTNKMLFNGPYCKLFRRDIITNNNILFDTTIHYGEDTIFVLNYLLFCKKVSFCEGSHYYYDLREDSLSHRKITWENAKREYDCFVAIQKQLTDCFGKSIPDTLAIASRKLLLTDRCWTAALGSTNRLETMSRLKQIDWKFYRKHYSPLNWRERLLVNLLANGLYGLYLAIARR